MPWSRAPLVLLLASTGCNETGLTAQPIPDAPYVRILPDEPRTADELTAEVVHGDGATDVTYRYSWARDGQALQDLESESVEALHTSKGEVWTLTVTPLRGNLEGTPGIAQATILNTPPELSAEWANATPGSFEDLSVVTTTTDQDDDPVTLSYAWSVDGVEIPHTESSVPFEQTDRGQIWQVTITPFDGEEDGEPVTLTTEIGNTAPEIGWVELMPDPAFTDSTLTAIAHDTFDADGDPFTVRYDWFVEGTLVQSGDSSELMPDHFVKHDLVYVEAVASDELDEATPVSSADLIISNSPPTRPVTPSLLPERPTPDDDLLCSLSSPSTDADEDPISYNVEFYVDGSMYSTEVVTDPVATLPFSSTVLDQVWTCRFQAVDDEGATSDWSDHSEARTISDPYSNDSIDYIHDRRTFARGGAGWTGEGSGMSISEERGHLAVWDGYNSTLRVFDLETGANTVHPLGGGGSGKGIDYTPDGSFLFAAGNSSSWLHKVDTSTYSVVATSTSFGARGTDIRVITEDRFLLATGDQLRLYDYDLNLLSTVSCPYAGWVSFDEIDSKVYVSGVGYNSGRGVGRMDLDLSTDTLTLDWQEGHSAGYSAVIPLFDHYVQMTEAGVVTVHRKTDRAVVSTFSSFGEIKRTAAARYSADTLAFIDTVSGDIYRYSELEGEPVPIGLTPTPYMWANGFEVSPHFLAVYWNRSSPGLELFRIVPM